MYDLGGRGLGGREADLRQVDNCDTGPLEADLCETGSCEVGGRILPTDWDPCIADVAVAESYRRCIGSWTYS